MHLSTVDVRTSATVFAADPKLILVIQRTIERILRKTKGFHTYYTICLTKNDIPGAATFDRSVLESKHTRIFVPP